MLILHSAVEHRRVNMGRGPLILCVLVRLSEKIGEVDETGERENLCLWSVSSAARNET